MRKARKAKEKKKVIYTKTLSGKRMFMYDTLPKEVRLKLQVALHDYNPRPLFEEMVDAGAGSAQLLKLLEVTK
jgi:hypothetical protein